MTAGPLPSLSYNAQQYRVRLELTREVVSQSPLPPPDLVQRAKAKLESVQKAGKIVFFEIYEDRLISAWKALRQGDHQQGAATSSPHHPPISISFTLAAGSPAIDGFSAELVQGDRPGLAVTFSKPLDQKLIPREWIRATVLKAAKDHGLKDGLFMPQLQSALMRLNNNDPVDHFHILSAGAIPRVTIEGKVFTVMANKNRGEIVVFVGDIMALQSSHAQDSLCEVIRQTIEKMRAAGSSPMRFLKSEMISCIKSAASGLERLGIGTPLAVLAAIPAVQTANIPKSDSTAKKYFQITVSEDRMTAKISNFQMKTYTDPTFVMTKEQINEQLGLIFIKNGLTDDIFALLEDAFKKRANLDQMVLAQGTPSSAGADPYLHLVYKDAPVTSEALREKVNIRDAQQRMVVQKGQFVAEIRFKKQPVIGVNLFGQALPPIADAPFQITIGEGIQQKEAGRFYAMWDGVPSFEGDKLTITKSLIHEGDVNLKTGNIYFDGPVEIKGSVEHGAVVRVRGPLKIHGCITGGVVISKEPIEVLQHIVTGEAGKILCGTSVFADFIENSKIECSGNVTVNKSIISSEIMAGGIVNALANDSVIGGGTIMCKTIIAAANIGFTKGARTNLIVGVDSKIVKRIRIRQKRLDNLTKAHDRYKAEFREISQKKENQLTPHLRQLKDHLRENLTNVRQILERAKAKLEEANSEMTYNSEALIAATNVLAANCSVEIGGHGVKLEVDTIAAVVSAKKRRDTHICTYDELKSDVEKKLGSAKGTDSGSSSSTSSKASAPADANRKVS